jgi:predicted dehydrogenase
MESIRVGIIGIGNMGSAHAANLYDGKISGMKLAAVCDVAPLKQAWAAERLPEIPVYSNYEELLQSGVCDAVIVATPHEWHPIMASAALRAGLHVLTEKPEGVSLSAVKKLNALAAETDRVFAIMFNQRTNPLFRRARELVQSGALGELKRLTWIITNWYRTQAYYNSGGWRATWTGEGGGVLLNQCPHQLDLLQWIFGMPDQVFAICREAQYHNIEVEDCATIVMNYRSGAEATFITTTGEYPGTNRLEIAGDRGKIVVEEGKLKYWDLGFSEREYCFTSDANSCNRKPTYTEYVPDEPETAHNGVLQAFADAILHGTPLIARGEEGACELEISNAAYLSAWTGRPVSLPMDTEAFDRYLAEKRANSKSRESADYAPEGKLTDRWSVKWF